MDKYTELLKDIASLIADTNRENVILKYDLESVNKKLAEAESKIAVINECVDKFIGTNKNGYYEEDARDAQ